MSQYKMSKVKSRLFIPEELLSEIDRLVGKRKRSEFITEAIVKEVIEMNVAYLELNEAGNLVIPKELLKELGFKPMDKAKIELDEGRMIVEKEEENLDSVLEELFGNDLIPSEDFNEVFKDWIKTDVTFEQLDEMFKGKSLPIEETIRKERQEREKYLRDGFHHVNENNTVGEPECLPL
jgi:bifunctional DNA-binding transcriptional regulator/antitoxin component of YhaV-PrlF toxin-antitoxin module